MGIRPTHFEIRPKKTDELSIPTEVYISEPLGEVQIIDLIFGTQRIKVVTSPDIKVTIGENVWLSFSLGKSHIFDAETGQKIG